MKNTIKVLACVIVLFLGFTSCSKETGESLGRDAVNNIIRSGKWTQQTKTVWIGEAAGVTTEMLEEGEYLEFTKENKVWIYNTEDGLARSVPYELTNPKTMMYDGVEYGIQENIIGSINQLTLIHQSDGTKTQIVFRR